MNNWLLTDAEIEEAVWEEIREPSHLSHQDFLDEARSIARAQLRKVMRGIELEGHYHLCNLPLWKELRQEAGLGGGRSG